MDFSKHAFHNQVLAARSYIQIGHAIVAVNWNAKKWGTRARERYEEAVYCGRHSASVAKDYKEHLYDLKKTGLLHLLQNNAADLMPFRCEENNNLRVRIPAADGTYVAHTKWAEIPDGVKDSSTVDNCKWIYDTLDYYQRPEWLNIPQSIKLLETLK